MHIETCPSVNWRAASSAVLGAVRSGSRRQHAHRDPTTRSLHAGSLEQGPLDRPESPSQAERCLGYSGSPSAAGPETRSCLVQPCDRQQAPRLRSRSLASQRRMRRRQGAASWHRDPEKDRATGSVRITEQTQRSVHDGLSGGELRSGRYLFPSRLRAQPHLSTRQYARIVHAWVESAGLDSSAYGTHSMRRTKAAQIYRKTGNLRAVQLLLGHTKLESTVRYLGIEVDDALRISEQVEL